MAQAALEAQGNKMSKNKNKYKKGKIANPKIDNLINQLRTEQLKNAQLQTENEKLKTNKKFSEALLEHRLLVKQTVNDFLTKENFPLAFKDNSDQKTIFRSLLNSTKTYVYDMVDEPLAFFSAFQNKQKKPLHPSACFTWIEDLGEYIVNHLIEEGSDMKESIKNYISETANVRDKSIGFGEFAHCIIWQNAMKACLEEEGDISILLNNEDEYGFWDDKGNGGHMPTIKGHGGKLKTQDKVLKPLYGTDWKSKYSAKGKKSLDKLYMPHILEQDSSKLMQALDMYSDVGEEKSTNMQLEADDKLLVIDFFKKHPVESFEKTPQNLENAFKREQYLSLLLLRRSCIVNNMSGIRFNYYDEEKNVVSTAFLRPAKMSIETLEEHLKKINKHIEFNFVKTNTNSNFAYNDGCIKTKKVT